MPNQGASAGKATPQDRASGAKKAQEEAGDANGARSSATADAIALLKADHRQVEQFFDQFASADEDRKAELVEQICQALTIHTVLEEEIFYPACREKAADEAPLDDAQVEHDSAKMLIADLERGRGADRYRDAKVRVLAEQVKHHVAEEEKARSGIFAKAQQAGVNTPELGAELQQRKQELESRGELPSGRPVSFTSIYRAEGAQTKESEMASYQQTRERDSRGRFMEEDDRRGRGRDDDRSYSSRGSNYRERDEEGRFTSGDGRRGGGRDDDDRSRGRDEGRGWYGDSRGHSEAARRGWDEREGGRSRGRGYDDDDRSYRSRSSRDDDDRDSRGRGRGGWFGDSEGHSEAARRGWDNPDHAPSGWYGDSRGHSEASRRGWDNPDHGPSGWYGDPEGHSEASRRGWDDRGSSRSSRGGRYDDDDRSYRSRSSRDDDDRDSRGRGRGGWFGDPEGHSEASHRGWENRR